MKERKLDVRVLAATNSDLMQRVEDGSFRRDLYYRLERFRIEIPPLRERKEDVPALVKHFAGSFAKEMGRAVPEAKMDFRVTVQGGIGTSEVEHVFSTQTLQQNKSKTMRVHFDGDLPVDSGWDL